MSRRKYIFSLFMGLMIELTTALPVTGGLVSILLTPPDGWNILYPPETYTPETLHEYINGAADLYLRYDLLEAQTAVYVNKSDSSLTYTADLYIFSDPLCAFGIYSRYRHAASTVAGIGAEAVVSAMNVRFWQDRYYVNLVAGSTDARMAQLLIEAAEAFSAKLPPAPPPHELSLLPQEHRLPNSLKYHHRNYLQVEGLNRVIEAEYQKDVETWTLFLVLCGNEAERLAAEEKLRHPPKPVFQRWAGGFHLIGVRGLSDADAKNILKHLGN